MITSMDIATRYKQEVLRDKPVGFWMLDEAAGTLAREWRPTTSPIPGTYTGIPVLGQLGPAPGVRSVYLPGSASNAANYITTASTASLSLFGDGAIEIWVKPTTSFWAGNYTSIVCKRDINGGPNNNYEIYLEAGTGKLGLYNGNLHTTSYIPPLNQWVQIVAQVLSNTLIFLINGQILTTFSSTGFGSTDTAPFQIGYIDAGGGDTQQFNGYVGPCSVHLGTMSPSRFAAHYSAMTRPLARRIYSFPRFLFRRSLTNRIGSRSAA